MYAVQASFSHKTSDGYTGTRYSPIFYLDENVQGIRDEAHARQIALDIITTAVSVLPINDTINVTAVRV